MARSLTLPQIFRTTTTAFTDVRLVDTGSGTESVVTKATCALGAARAQYWTPETAVNTPQALADYVNDARQGVGWILLNAFVDPLTIDEGTITLVIHYSRASTVLHANRTSTIRAIVYHVSSTNTTPVFIGTGITASLTFTTTEQSVTLSFNISGNDGAVGGGPIVVPASGRMYIEMYTDAETAIGVTDLLLHTNSATATRITAFPSFTVQFGRELVDTDADATIDSISRVYNGARLIADSIALSDSVTRQFTGARTMADTDASGVTDSLTRQFTGARTLVDIDTDGVIDTLARTFTGARTLSDINSVADSVNRAVAAARSLSDVDANGVTDSLSRITTFNRALADTDATGVTDSIFRQTVQTRTLTDIDATGVQDAITRDLIYGRTLKDDLTGGGTIVNKYQPNFIFEE